MPTRKQRRRRQKELRHDYEYVYVDAEGREVEVDEADDPTPRRNGKRETKQQFIDAISGGHRRYRQIEVQSQDVLPVGSKTWLITGRALFEIEANHGALLYPIAYTAIQTQESGQWRLVAWHATRCALE